MKRILVAGVNGFVGQHLVNALVKDGHDVYGTGMQSEADRSIRSNLKSYFRCDLTNPNEVKGLTLDSIDAVINLAGLAQVGASFDNPDEYLRVNVAVHEVLIKQILRINPSVRVVSISTGAVYDSNQKMPLEESSNLVTNGSPYAQSKIAMEHMLESYAKAGMNIVIARPFNHIGPGQLGGFLVPDLAAQVIAGNKLRVGNLKTRRDYTDVRDVVRAYIELATKDNLYSSIYNVCSGKSVSGEEILRELINAAGKKIEDFDISLDESKIRPADPLDIYGSNHRLQEDLGWSPKIHLSETINDFVKSLPAT